MEKLDKIFESVESEVLSDDNKLKIKTLFEATINEAIEKHIENLNKDNEDYLQKERALVEHNAVEYIDKYLIKKFSEYSNLVAERFMKDNEVAIDNGLKAEMFDKLMEDFKGVFSKYSIPEDKVEDLENMEKTVSDMKSKMNEAMENEIEAKNELKILKANIVLENEISDASEIEKAKIRKLVSSFNVDNLDEFKSKVKTIKESVVKNDDHQNNKDEDENDNAILETTEIEDEEDTKVSQEAISKYAGTKYLSEDN